MGPALTPVLTFFLARADIQGLRGHHAAAGHLQRDAAADRQLWRTHVRERTSVTLPALCTSEKQTVEAPLCMQGAILRARHPRADIPNRGILDMVRDMRLCAVCWQAYSVVKP